MPFVPKSEFLTIMTERGFIQDSTDLAQLDDKFSSKQVVAYIGYDATAKSLHVGHLVQLHLWAEELQK